MSGEREMSGPVALLAAAEEMNRRLVAFLEAMTKDALAPVQEHLYAFQLAIKGARSVPPETLIRGTVFVDTAKQRVDVAGFPIHLTRKEFQLLVAFMMADGAVCRTPDLWHTIWGYRDTTFVDTHTVKVHVSALRRKLGPEVGRKIVNLPGIGYRMDP